MDDVDGIGVCGGDGMPSKLLPLLFTIFPFEFVGLFFTQKFEFFEKFTYWDFCVS